MSDFSFWEFFWLVVSTALFLAYLIVLFQIVGDLLRDRTTGGFAKAVWVFGLLVLPFLTALLYLVVRGNGMYARQEERYAEAQAGMDQYIQSVAGKRSPAADIAEAKALLDSGSISQAEFEALKAKALA
mgnify:CR=1 FL=1